MEGNLRRWIIIDHFIICELHVAMLTAGGRGCCKKKHIGTAPGARHIATFTAGGRGWCKNVYRHGPRCPPHSHVYGWRPRLVQKNGFT